MKALRLYDRRGLLTPADVDPDTGYRRYRESQLATARLIVLLRRLNMPLADVAELVAAPAAVGAELLVSYWDMVERRMANQRELATYVKNRLLGQHASVPLRNVQQRDVPEQLVLAERRPVKVDQLSAWIGSAMVRLMKSASRCGGPVASPFVVYYGEVNEDSDGPAEACVPIDSAHGTRDDPAIR